MSNQTKKCERHDWIPCPGGICTSDLHNAHCKDCGIHENLRFAIPQDTSSWEERHARFLTVVSGHEDRISYLEEELEKLKKFLVV